MLYIILQVPLSDIIVDRDLMYKFLTFIKETNGPINHFNFVLAATQIQDRLHSKQTTDAETKSVTAHIQYDCWELYKTYLREESDDYLGR